MTCGFPDGEGFEGCSRKKELTFARDTRNGKKLLKTYTLWEGAGANETEQTEAVSTKA